MGRLQDYNRYMRASLIVMLLNVFGCQTEVIPQTNDESVSSDELLTSPSVVMTAPDISFDEPTKSSAEMTDGGLQFSWSEGDIVGVYSSKGSMSTFRLKGGEGSSKGIFDGGGFDLKKGEGYYALYPYSGFATDKNNITLSYQGQVLSSDLSKSQIGKHDYMSSYAVVDEAGNASFSFRHLGSFVRMDLVPDSNVLLNSMTIVPHSGTIASSVQYDLEKSTYGEPVQVDRLSAELTDTELHEGEKSTIWMALPPQDLSGRSLSAIFTSDDGIYTSNLQGRNLQASKAYRMEGSLVRYSYDDYAADIGIDDLGQTPLDVMTIDDDITKYISTSDLYQFSSIAPISAEGNSYRFAVVSDKGKGGGVFTLDLEIDAGGSIVSSHLGSLAGTAQAKDVRDPEGLVVTQLGYLVSGEDQRIVEYDFSGYPTGREASVPSDMSPDMVTFNMGFEALAYDGQSTVYAVSEGPLLSDIDYCPVGDLGSLLRIQSFNADDLSASYRYLYLMDRPTYSNPPEDAVHVHGVSAMTVLPDGRLAVLEREVYTNISTISASSRVKIYLVDPKNDRGGILSKVLLHEFSTGIDLMKWELNLANYEGMCCITLPDGSPALVLVNDAQGHLGYSWGKINSKLKDYIRIIRLQTD